MKSLNKITLLSTVTRDGELKEVAAGKSVYTFGLVTNRVWKDAKGEKQTLSEFHNIICWGELAVFAGQYVKKGKPLYVEGYLKTRSCEPADGIRRYHIEIVVENIVLLGAKGVSTQE